MSCRTVCRSLSGWLLAGALLCGAGAAGATTITSRVQGETLIAANPTDPQAYEDFAAFYMAIGNAEEAAAVLRTPGFLSSKVLI